MQDLHRLVEQELLEPVDPRVATLAAAVADNHRDAARAVLFYGSCLREQQLDGLMLDFYLIVSDYRQAYGKAWLAGANRLIPPNVFYFEKDGLRSKYAVLSEADFRRECGPDARSISVLARFAQPARLVWRRDKAASDEAVRSIALAAPALLDRTSVLVGNAPLVELWKKAFSLSFGAELRAERSDRSARIVEADPSRYERFGKAALSLLRNAPRHSPAEARRWWRRMQRKGKYLSVLRLAKASATFAGGVDYIAWKVNRHAGTKIAIKPWQRRWPLLAAISLVPRLLKSGAIR